MTEVTLTDEVLAGVLWSIADPPPTPRHDDGRWWFERDGRVADWIADDDLRASVAAICGLVAGGRAEHAAEGLAVQPEGVVRDHVMTEVARVLAVAAVWAASDSAIEALQISTRKFIRVVRRRGLLTRARVEFEGENT